MELFENQNTKTETNSSVGYNDPFEQIANSEVTERSVYFEEGVYPVLYLDVMKMVNSRKGDTFFVAEFDILEVFSSFWKPCNVDGELQTRRHPRQRKRLHRQAKRG
jgi:hypothetical protein